MNFFNRTEEKFWKWFGKNLDELSNPEQEGYDEILDHLLHELHKYCDKLYFEIGCTEDGMMELIVTADGDEKYFPKVRKLVESAPNYNNWIITAFKPPMENTFKLDHLGVILDTEKVLFEPLENDSNPMDLGLLVFIEGYDEDREEDFFQVLSIALQTIIGELSFVNDIKYIEIQNTPANSEDYIPLSDLLHFIEWRKSKLGIK